MSASVTFPAISNYDYPRTDGRTRFSEPKPYTFLSPAVKTNLFRDSHCMPPKAHWPPSILWPNLRSSTWTIFSSFSGRSQSYPNISTTVVSDPNSGFPFMTLGCQLNVDQLTFRALALRSLSCEQSLFCGSRLCGIRVVFLLSRSPRFGASQTGYSGLSCSCARVSKYGVWAPLFESRLNQPGVRH